MFNLSQYSNTLNAVVGNLATTGRVKKQGIAILCDASASMVCLWFAYTLRLEAPYSDFASSWPYFILLPSTTVLVFAGFGIYRWVIRSSNTRMFLQVFKAALVSSVILLIFMFLSPAGGPRSLFAIYFLLFVGATMGVRVIWQLLMRGDDGFHVGEPTAIYGAGRQGRELVALMHMTKEANPVLFLDDNVSLTGSTIAGIPVFNPKSVDLGPLLESNEISRVVLASQNLDHLQIQTLLGSLNIREVSVQTVPSISEVVAGRAQAGETREISVSDLLGRNEVPPNNELLSKCVTGKNVFVTGGGGSIGSEICRQIVLLNPLSLIILDQSEENLYRITEEINALFSNVDNSLTCKVVPVLGSVLDDFKVRNLLRLHHIHTVYHAAAYKHVPIIESASEEGFRTNVRGTQCVLEAAIDNHVEKFVLISTDKAVRPTNVMGATKRLAELVLQAKAELKHATDISMVRFGNVLGSSGSVVPKFRSQIEQGGPITITHPEITRYFMSIPEASQLVLQASALSSGGEVFVLDMGDPVKIVDLARDMVALSGKRVKDADCPDGDIEILMTGLRPGEKLYEEMFISDDARGTAVPKIFVAREESLVWEELNRRLTQIQNALHSAPDEVIFLIHDAISTIDQREKSGTPRQLSPAEV